ncbi:MAG TPA: SIMPL domain-containing protein [Nocardioidaceae bacterium]|nr:SIMPL domain-containing protein [Nocardioidaceae bacterium]
MSPARTVSVRSLGVAVGVLIAVMLAYAVGFNGGGAPEVRAAEAPPATTADPAREIVMRGTGEATGVPDQLSFKLSVHMEATDVSSALNQANARMRRVLAALTTAGVQHKDVQTTGLSIRPVYDYSDNAPAVITGYTVSEDAGVLVRSLGDAGGAIAAAASAGGNAVRLHGVSLKIGDEGALMRDARDNAVGEAQAKARQYAEATGQELGDVISVKEVSARRSGPVPAFAERSLFDTAGLSKVPVRAGSADLSVTVSVEWSLA